METAELGHWLSNLSPGAMLAWVVWWMLSRGLPNLIEKFTGEMKAARADFLTEIVSSRAAFREEIAAERAHCAEELARVSEFARGRDA